MFVLSTQVGYLWAEDGKIVGAWYGHISTYDLANNLLDNTPSVVTFHADGTVKMERADRLEGGAVHQYLPLGSWEKTGGKSFKARLVFFMVAPAIPAMSIRVMNWEGELSEDHEELTISGYPEMFFCSEAVPSGFTCPDPIEGTGALQPRHGVLVLRRIEP